MRESVAAVVLAILFLAAGCSMLGPGGTGTDADADGSPTLSADERPPGVAQNGTLVDEAALLDGHVTSVVETGVVWDIRTNATVYQQNQIQRVVRHQRTYVETDTREYGYALENPGTNFQVWGNRSVQVIQATVGSRTRYRVTDPATDAALAGRPVLTRQLHEGALSVTAVDRSGETTLVTLKTTEPPRDAGAFPSNATDIRDYHATLVVDTDGRIHRFEASATYTLRGETGHSRFRYKQVKGMSPNVTQPEWAREALRNASHEQLVAI